MPSETTSAFIFYYGFSLLSNNFQRIFSKKTTIFPAVSYELFTMPGRVSLLYPQSLSYPCGLLQDSSSHTGICRISLPIWTSTVSLRNIDLSEVFYSSVNSVPSRKSPLAGAVGPARLRSFASRISLTDEGFMAPRPTSIRVPTMIRTML
jgi:hypothetical protein